MTGPSEGKEGTEKKLPKWWTTFSRMTKSKRQVALWGLLIGIVASTSLIYGSWIWWHSGSNDLLARRWKTRDPVVESPGYKCAVRPHSISEKCPTREVPTGMSPDWTTPHVAVYSVVAPHVHPTLRDLADRGQARAIDFLEHDSLQHDSAAWSEVQQALNDGSGPGLGENDPFKFERILVATVTKGINWDPGDRMMWTRVFVQPINFTFAGYTVAATDNVTVKVTSVEASKTRKFSADLGLTIPGVDEGPKASIDPSNERTIKATSDITAQYEKLGIDVVPSFLRIIRESETGGDVVGNTTVSLSVVTDALMIHKHAPTAPIPSSVDNNSLVLLVRKTKLDEINPKDNSIDVLPQAGVPHCALKARIWMLYEQRHIEAGRKYYDEAMQGMSLNRDVDYERDMEIVSADDVSPAVWRLKICSGECNPTEKDPNLKAFVAPHGKQRDLVFTDYGEAVKLAHWLRYQRPGTIVSHLQFNYPIAEDPQKSPGARNQQKSLMPYKIVGDECDNKEGSINNPDR
jgi:hypothetical protein